VSLRPRQKNQVLLWLALLATVLGVLYGQPLMTWLNATLL
jgi:hypothetical protein